jgi:sodium-dependent dicarboxylate transporter 2/3/5
MNPPEAVITEQEERFERFRQSVGFFLAPLLGLFLWFLPIPGLDPAAHRLLAILGLVVMLWVTESLPLPVTALLGPALCVLAGIRPAVDAFKSFADPIIFLFIGSFLLAEAMLHHGLNRRVAFVILGLPGVGESPFRLLLAFGGTTAFLSMWISNTATTAMMFPIGIAILSEMARLQAQRSGRERDFRQLRYGTGLMLITAFGASIGGLATPVGTPPNLIGRGFLERSLDVQISFFQWMAFGLPLAAVLIVFLVFHLNRACPAEPGLLAGSAAWIRAEKARLGPLKPGERNVLIVFALMVTFWLLPGAIAVIYGTDDPGYRALARHLPEPVVALLGAVLLFALPTDARRGEFTLTWREGRRIDWGTILLFGGGLALGEMMFNTGLARWIGEGLAGAVKAKSGFALTVLFTVIAVIVSETTSNAASANMVVPVAIAVAQGAGVDPVPPALAACLGASLGFMLPVSTPPNAIVYGSGCVPLTKMIRYGLALDLAGIVAVIVIVTWLVPRLL